MDISKFSEAQKDYYVVVPDVSLESDLDLIPFEKLLDKKESREAVLQRWELYNQLHSAFHFEVESIISNIEHDLRHEISDLLFEDDDSSTSRLYFRSLFLLGSDSSTTFNTPPSNNEYFVELIELTPKECPNVRMALRRSMFKIYASVDKKLSEEHVKNDNKKDIAMEDMENSVSDTSYDLSLLENFERIFGRKLKLIINFKDVDTINPEVLDNFLRLLSSALKYDHIDMKLVFNISTNLSNLEKNLKRSTIRHLKKNFDIVDISSNKGFKYENRIFDSFLDTVDGKLNLSERFVNFILIKMANKTNHSIQSLTRILDYSLMSYFFQNPFSIFIDPVNISYLNDDYLKLLTRCPTFMFFIESLLEQDATNEEILHLLTNENKTLEDFFTEFLVRSNPINQHAKKVAKYLTEVLKVNNFNLIELYHEMLKGNLKNYLSAWPECLENPDLTFEPVDTMFEELFTLDNNNNLLSQALFPKYKTNIEDDLLSWETILPSFDYCKDEEKTKVSLTLQELNKKMPPVLGGLFKLYREAGCRINVYDFFVAYKESMPKVEILNYLKEVAKDDSSIRELLNSSSDDDVVFEKIVLTLFLRGIADCENIGILRTNKTAGDVLEKITWRGI